MSLISLNPINIHQTAAAQHTQKDKKSFSGSTFGGPFGTRTDQLHEMGIFL